MAFIEKSQFTFVINNNQSRDLALASSENKFQWTSKHPNQRSLPHPIFKRSCVFKYRSESSDGFLVDSLMLISLTLTLHLIIQIHCIHLFSTFLIKIMESNYKSSEFLFEHLKMIGISNRKYWIATFFTMNLIK